MGGGPEDTEGVRASRYLHSKLMSGLKGDWKSREEKKVKYEKRVWSRYGINMWGTRSNFTRANLA